MSRSEGICSVSNALFLLLTIKNHSISQSGKTTCICRSKVSRQIIPTVQPVSGARNKQSQQQVDYSISGNFFDAHNLDVSTVTFCLIDMVCVLGHRGYDL